jgi:transglutaminase-like putative cysteine protease
MQLTLRHATNYSYSEPITYLMQVLRQTPQPYEGLSIVKWQVRGASRRELPSFIDGFGNRVHGHSINRVHEAVTLTVDGTVETRDTGGVVHGAPETLPPGFYLRTTGLTAIDADNLGWVGDVGTGSLDWAMRLMGCVRDKVDYRPGTSQSTTTAQEALAAGVGVCQDHAQIFIAACRLAGVPARYVSGYLWTGSTGGANETDEASHAWAEAYLDDRGWVGFDPANRTRPTESYIRIAIGLDYHSAAPVRGVRRGVAAEAMNVSVRVTAAAAEQ